MDEKDIKIEDDVIKESVSKRNNSMTKKIRENPWIISTLALAILAIVLVVGGAGLGITGNSISEKKAESIFLNSLSTAGADTSQVEITKIEKEGGLYKFTFDYQGQVYPASYYITKDGSLMGVLSPTSSTTKTNTNTQTTEIPKSDSPEVELFIWSYCPYGVQAQTPFAEVAELLKDSGADFKVNLYYDGHGEHETQQNKIEACIQKVSPDKYWEYAKEFVANIYPKCGSTRDAECNEQESLALMNKLGIDSSAVMSCVESEGQDLIDADYARAQEVGVTGSPTLVINGVKANPSARTADAFKESICGAFNDAPEICGTQLSTEATASSGSC